MRQEQRRAFIKEQISVFGHPLGLQSGPWTWRAIQLAADKIADEWEAELEVYRIESMIQAVRVEWIVTVDVGVGACVQYRGPSEPEALKAYARYQSMSPGWDTRLLRRLVGPDVQVEVTATNKGVLTSE